MATNTTRIDVEVNTNSAKNKLRELAEEAKRNNIDATRIEQASSNIGNNNLSNNYSKQAAEEARRISKEIEREKKAEISNEHRELRKQQLSEFNDIRKQHRLGKITDQDFENERVNFQKAQLGSYSDERLEKRNVEQEQLQTLEKILESLRRDEKERTIDQQRDGDEFNKGILGELFDKRSKLQAQRISATSEDEINDKNRELKDVDKSINKLLGNNKNNYLNNISNSTDAISSISSGASPTAMMGLLSKIGPYGIAAAAIGSAAYSVASRVGDITESTAPLASIRIQGDRDQIRNSSIENRKTFEDIGINDKDQWQIRYRLAMSSGIGLRGNADYAAKVSSLEKGYGINDVSSLSTNERGDKYGKTTADNIVEMLNVLSQIRDGSIKPNDLTLANEKASLMFRLQSSQLNRNDKFDNKDITKVMAAFETLGGSGKDNRAGDFIEGAFSGLREGGNQSQMLLKIQAAKEAHPELADNPVALSKIVEKSDDPRYLSSAIKMIRRITSGDEIASYNLMKNMFPSLNVDQRDKLYNAKNEFFNTIEGRKYLRSQGIFSTNDANSYAEKNTSSVSSISSWTSDMADDVVENLKDITKNTTSILNNLFKRDSNNQSAQKNKVR